MIRPRRRGTITTLVTDRNYGYLRGTDGREYVFAGTQLVNALFADLFEGQEVTSFTRERSLHGAADVVVVPKAPTAEFDQGAHR